MKRERQHPVETNNEEPLGATSGLIILGISPEGLYMRAYKRLNKKTTQNFSNNWFTKLLIQASREARKKNKLNLAHYFEQLVLMTLNEQTTRIEI